MRCDRKLCVKLNFRENRVCHIDIQGAIRVSVTTTTTFYALRLGEVDARSRSKTDFDLEV